MDTFTPEQIEKTKSFNSKDIGLYNQYRIATLTPEQAINAVLQVKTGKEQPIAPKVPVIQKIGKVAGVVADIVGGKELAQGAGQALASGYINKLSEETRIQAEAIQNNIIDKIKEARALGDTSKANYWAKLLQSVDTGAGIQKEFQDNLVTDNEVIGSAVKLAATAAGSFTGGRSLGVTGSLTKAAMAEGAIQMGGYALGEGISKDKSAGNVVLDTLRNAAIGGAGGAVLGVAAKGATKLLERRALNIADRKASRLKDLIKKQESILNPTNEAETRLAAEATAPQLTISEKSIGMTPDVKRRIRVAGEELTNKYIDVAKARNLNDTLPSPYEYGSSRANEAEELMLKKLNDTGGEIGATREKLGTYKASNDQLNEIETALDKHIKKLNLRVKNGAVSKRIDAISSASTGDMKVIDVILNNLKTVKASPTLTNLIDLRNSVDANIHFGKGLREVTSEIEPLSRELRSVIADVNRRIVGKTEAAKLAEYSDYIDAYKDLKSYTDRKAGGEYMLRLVLSGRGGEARKILDTIRKYTGIDLMNDATLMKLVTEKLGNDEVKTLFAQEVSKITGVASDLRALTSGNPVGGIVGLVTKAKDALIDPEKVIREAAKLK